MEHNVKGFGTHEFLVVFSTKTDEAFLHLHYDHVDDKNHKSVNQLVHHLNDSGYHDIATIIEEQKPYIVFENPVFATKVREFIHEHTAAVFGSLYFLGEINEAAVRLIDAKFPHDKVEHLHHSNLKFKK
jgi:DNA-binding LacI/PurR family transcriptional regulator